jgi:hypothetical protein
MLYGCTAILRLWGLLCNPVMKTICIFPVFPCNGAPVEWNWIGKTNVLGGKTVPVPKAHMEWRQDRTGAFAVTGRRLTARAMARPFTGVAAWTITLVDEFLPLADHPVFRLGLVPESVTLTFQEQSIPVVRAWTQYYGTAQTTDCSLSTWYRSAVLEECRVSWLQDVTGWRSFRVASCSRTRTLSFLEHWYCTVSLSKTGNQADRCGILPLSSDCDWRNDVRM